MRRTIVAAVGGGHARTFSERKIQSRAGRGDSRNRRGAGRAFPERIDIVTAARRNCRRVSAAEIAACKSGDLLFIPRSAASFVIKPLVPGYPSLDVKPHSPGETRQRNCRFKISDFRFKGR